ncbi:HD domain-containing protein [Cecembia sp.]|uniref:HD domain-containing protein n=1 Tax=Cecembia sp. TaxID=1898110 RepID=UPI0025C5078F|nr:HD domain-containing protein [Cecembia sp.]
MMMHPMHKPAYEAIFKAAEKYMRVRKNDVHIPLSYRFALELMEHYPEVNQAVVAAGIILHDIGWYAIDEEEIFEKGFSGPDLLTSDVRYLHESEGVNYAKPLLASLGYEEDFIEKVCTIIDGHDTRNFAKSKEDEIVRDADKLWRFAVTGVSVACDWFKMTPVQYAQRLEDTNIEQLHLPESVAIAKRELTATRALLLAHVL